MGEGESSTGSRVEASARVRLTTFQITIGKCSHPRTLNPSNMSGN